MNYWMFTVSKKSVGNKVYEPFTILEQRFSDAFWGFRQHTLKRRELAPNDRVVFYLGVPIKAFAASATIATPPFKLTEEQNHKYGHGNSLYNAEYGVLLQETQLWDKPKAVKEVIPDLSFIGDRENWGVYFQGGIRRLSMEDFLIIVGSS